jgi:hypothetical protein
LKHLEFNAVFSDNDNCFAEWNNIERVDLIDYSHLGVSTSVNDLSILVGIAKIPRLRSLQIGFEIAPIPGQLAVLSQCESLEDLKLSHLQINDGAVTNEISQLQQLKSLHLGYAAKLVTDSSTRSLASMSRLEKLNIEGTSISDAGAREFANLPRLEHLVVADHISDETINYLRRTIPHVYRESDVPSELYW